MAERLLHSSDSDYQRIQSEEIDAVHELETPNVVMANCNNRDFVLRAHTTSQILERIE